MLAVLLGGDDLRLVPLRRQAEVAAVAGSCGCGRTSIRIRDSPPPLRAIGPAQLSPPCRMQSAARRRADSRNNLPGRRSLPSPSGITELSRVGVIAGGATGQAVRRRMAGEAS
jgi:hypothetical protein